MQNNYLQSANSELTLQLSEPLRSTSKGTNNNSTFKTFLFDTNCHEKKALEAFISNTFSKHYGAHLLHFYPNLFGAYDDSQAPYAAVGYRTANEHCLFLEQYLNHPIEVTLSNFDEEKSIQPLLNRNHIVEIGNLAATKHGACRKLFQLLTQYFHKSQYRWIVFTATRTVRVVIKRMRLKAYIITPANADVLDSHHKKSWGSYYDQQPVVMAIPISQALPNSLNKFSISTKASTASLKG